MRVWTVGWVPLQEETQPGDSLQDADPRHPDRDVQAPELWELTSVVQPPGLGCSIWQPWWTRQNPGLIAPQLLPPSFCPLCPNRRVSVAGPAPAKDKGQVGKQAWERERGSGGVVDAERPHRVSLCARTRGLLRAQAGPRSCGSRAGSTRSPRRPCPFNPASPVCPQVSVRARTAA